MGDLLTNLVDVFRRTSFDYFSVLFDQTLLWIFNYYSGTMRVSHPGSFSYFYKTSDTSQGKIYA